MAPTLGNVGPLKMNGSIYKNTLTYGSPLSPESKGSGEGRAERGETKGQDGERAVKGFCKSSRTVLKQTGRT